MVDSIFFRRIKPMISLKDRLSHLTFRQASKLLGPFGKTLIMQGGKFP
jgi:hypothetical protein